MGEGWGVGVGGGWEAALIFSVISQNSLTCKWPLLEVNMLADMV